jgi:VanZ family protein
VLLVYVFLVAYASLYPFEGWRSVGLSPFTYLSAPWPRYVTAFDVAANFFGYLPYGLLCVLALLPRVAGAAAIGVAALTGAALSLALEAAQSTLPARIPSNLDVLANLGGALTGALLAAWLAPWLLGSGSPQRFRQSAFAPGVGADIGLTLLGLWLFAQLNPASLLFGAGDLRDLLAGDAGPLRGAQLFVSIEAAVAAANLAAVALLASAMTRAGAPRWQATALFGALLLAALLVKTLAFVILMRAENPLAWMTRGAQFGLAAGALLALAALALPRALRLMLAAVLLMTATVLVNLSPPNPYLAAILKVWEQGHFLNFNGLTRVVGSLWPFITLGYLIWLAAQRQSSPR